MTARSAPRKARAKRAGPPLVTAVDRAARVLLAFGQSWDFLSLQEVAARSGLSKPTAFRILSTLAAEGLVFQNEANNTYGLGFLTLRLADVVLSGVGIRDAARPAMRRIRDQVNETVVLSLRDRDACYNVDSLESTQTIGQAHAIGMAAPLHAVAPGRALLAASPDDAVDDYIARVRRPAAARAKFGQELWREIRLIRKQGYAVSAGEFMRAGHTIAKAIPELGDTAAALHISFPQSRFSKELAQRCVRALDAGARDIRAATCSAHGVIGEPAPASPEHALD
jgi:DNA-binding IclR family transcriptional regulator